MDISRSGRIRKKSSKLADFESPDEIDGINPIRKTSKISTKGQLISKCPFVVFKSPKNPSKKFPG